MRILDLGEVREGLGCSSWMGHLMPESGKGDANGNWTYDNGSSGTAMLQCSYWGGDAYQSRSSPTSGSASTSGARPSSSPGSKCQCS